MPSSLKRRLEIVRERLDGARVLALTGRDGLVVEAVNELADVDLEAAAAELTAELADLERRCEDLVSGPVEGITIACGERLILFGAVAESYYLLLVLDRPAAHGRARFELRRARLLFEGELD